MRARSVLIIAVVILVLSGCGGSSSAPPQPPPARLERTAGSSVPSVVLTPLGAERVGVQTAPVAAARRGHKTMAVLPYSAVLYLLNGTPVVYTNPSALVYRQVPISIDHISGNDVYIDRGVKVGTRVVTVGGEELLGVQEGVEAES